MLDLVGGVLSAEFGQISVNNVVDFVLVSYRVVRLHSRCKLASCRRGTHHHLRLNCIHCDTPTPRKFGTVRGQHDPGRFRFQTARARVHLSPGYEACIAPLGFSFRVQSDGWLMFSLSMVYFFCRSPSPPMSHLSVRACSKPGHFRPYTSLTISRVQPLFCGGIKVEERAVCV